MNINIHETTLRADKGAIAAAKASIEDIKLMRAQLDEFEKIAIQIIDVCEAAHAEIIRLADIVGTRVP